MRIIPIELLTPIVFSVISMMELEIHSQRISGTLSVEDLLGQGWANCGGCTRIVGRTVRVSAREDCWSFCHEKIWRYSTRKLVKLQHEKLLTENCTRLLEVVAVLLEKSWRRSQDKLEI